MRTTVPVFLMILMLIARCQRTEERSVSETRERFIRVYVELQNLKQYHTVTDSVLLDSSRAIIDKHGFTREEYEHMLAYFNEKPERWEAFYNEVLERLERANAPYPHPATQKR